MRGMSPKGEWMQRRCASPNDAPAMFYLQRGPVLYVRARRGGRAAGHVAQRVRGWAQHSCPSAAAYCRRSRARCVCAVAQSLALGLEWTHGLWAEHIAVDERHRGGARGCGVCRETCPQV